MPNADSLAAIAQMHLIQTVDDARAAGDPFKLPGWLRTQHDTDFAALSDADSHTALTESDRAGGSQTARAALDKLEGLAKDGYNFITAIRSTQITAAQRLQTFTAYGWAAGKLGRFGDARVIGLSRLAVQPQPDLQLAWKYPADLVADITAQLAIFDANVEDKMLGDRETATKARDTKLALAASSLAQVRFYYCSASRDTDQTPELAKISFQPKRAAGTVEHAKPKKPATGASAAPPA